MSSTSAGGTICTYSNPRLPLLRYFIPLSLIPGLTMIFLGGMVRGYTALLALGIIILVLAPLSIWLVDHFLRPTSVTLELDGVILRFANGKRTSIPYDKVDIRIVPPSPLSDNRKRGNIGNKDQGRTLYSISEEILEGVLSELKARQLYAPSWSRADPPTR